MSGISSEHERLTAEERLWFPAKALRIIDQLTAALEAAERDGAETYDRLITAHDRQHARAEALQARVTELEAQRDDIAELAQSKLNAAESELAQMRERVEAFRAEGLDAFVNRVSESALEDIEVLRGR